MTSNTCPLCRTQDHDLTLYAGIAQDSVVWVLPNAAVEHNIITTAAAVKIGAVQFDGVVTISVNLGGMRELVSAVVAQDADSEWDVMLGNHWARRHHAYCDRRARRFYFKAPLTSAIHYLGARVSLHPVDRQLEAYE